MVSSSSVPPPSAADACGLPLRAPGDGDDQVVVVEQLHQQNECAFLPRWFHGACFFDFLCLNLALNITEKGFPTSVYNRTASKVYKTMARAAEEGVHPLSDQYSPCECIISIARPRYVVILVKVGAPVDQTIAALSEPGDAIGDGAHHGGRPVGGMNKEVQERPLERSPLQRRPGDGRLMPGAWLTIPSQDKKKI